MLGRLGVSAIGYQIDLALVAQRKNEAIEHFFEPECMLAELFGWFFRIDPDLRQIEPIVCRY